MALKLSALFVFGVFTVAAIGGEQATPAATNCAAVPACAVPAPACHGRVGLVQTIRSNVHARKARRQVARQARRACVGVVVQPACVVVPATTCSGK